MEMNSDLNETKAMLKRWIEWEYVNSPKCIIHQPYAQSQSVSWTFGSEQHNQKKRTKHQSQNHKVD